MNSMRDSSERVTRALISPTSRGNQKALRADSCSQFEENNSVASGFNQVAMQANKMRKLNNARREWEQRHQSNSPFRIDNYGSSSSIGFDSVDGSPLPMNRCYGFR